MTDDILAEISRLLAEPPPITMYCAPGQRERLQTAADAARAKVDAERPFISLPPRQVTVVESAAVVDPNTVIVFDPPARPGEGR